MSNFDKLKRTAPIASQDSKKSANSGRQRIGPAGMRLSGSAIRSDSADASFRHHWILWAGPVAMLLAALLPWPYGYYNFLRFCVCGAAVFLAFQQWTHDDAASKWVVVLVAIALLYNPFMPVFLTREIWTVLNVGTAITLVGHYRSLQRLLRQTVDNSPQIERTRSGRTPLRAGKSHAISLLSAVGRGMRVFKRQMSRTDEVRRLAREQAEHGVADAQVAIGVMYLTAQGVERDAEKALSWLLKAAEQSDTDALYNLGIIFDTGFLGTRPPDAIEALKWFRRAASEGHDGAQYNLGVAYAEGKGVSPDRTRAIKWWRKAAEAGNARAQYNLGVSYSNGEGVAHDDVQAVAWWEKAAMPPNPAAKPEKAYSTAPSGIIVRQGLGDAGRGEHGYADAQYHLARMYALGQGVDRDKARSAEWLRRAAEQGHDGALAQVYQLDPI